MMKNNIINIIFDISAKMNIPAVIIGGLALPAYNVARTTIDIDICIHVKSQDQLNTFVSKLNEKGFETKQVPKTDHDLFTIFGNSSEAEIWLKPCDAFNWDNEMISKRINFIHQFYVLSREDFILTKLSRMDRSTVDIQDIIQIVMNNINIMDWDYLIYRLKIFKKIDQFRNILEELMIEENASVFETLKRIILNLKNERNY